MTIAHPYLRLAAGAALAAGLASACGGGSSGGGADSRTYQQGVAHGTATTLDLVLDDLQALQRSLAGSGDPVQTSSLSRAVTISISSLNLEPRQREDLAARLEAFIARLRMAQEAAAATDAGQAEAEAAQTAAGAALQALQLVVAADTAAQTGAGDAAQQAAITALTRIAEVEPDAPDAATTINRALTTALEVAEAQVAQLERDLAAAQAALGTQQIDQSAIATLTQQLTAARADLTALRNARVPRFGAPPTETAATVPRAGATYHPRRTGVRVTFQSNYDPLEEAPGSDDKAYDVTDFGAAVTDGFDLTPEPVVFDPNGVNRRVFAASNPNTAHFPGRGTVYRGNLRFIGTDVSMADAASNRIYKDQHRLTVQGQEYELDNNGEEGTFALNPKAPTSGVGHGNRWDNWDADAYMTFQYKPGGGGLTMGFGGNSVIFGDLKRYSSKVDATCVDPAAGGRCDNAFYADIEISFGEPQADLYGEPNTHYWHARAQSGLLPAVEPAQSAVDAEVDLTAPGDQLRDAMNRPRDDTGRYELILSAHAGDRRRLAYAAYGLFSFVDNGTSIPRVGRMQTFHYGVDAFADRTGRKPGDLAGAMKGVFHGKTAAWIVTSAGKSKTGNIRFNTIQNLFRARGDVKLQACIGGSGSCEFRTNAELGLARTLPLNKIEGRIENLEYAYGNRPGAWTQLSGGGIAAADLRTVTVFLEEADIEDNGTYRGTTAMRSFRNGNTLHSEHGIYEGAFYGPVGADLETAGTWRIDLGEYNRDMDAIIGSFGAVCDADSCAPPSVSQ